MFIGNPPGNHDRVLDFSTAVTGTLFFVPTTNQLEGMADPPPEPSTAVSEPETTNHDGSLGIGGLRGASA